MKRIGVAGALLVVAGCLPAAADGLQKDWQLDLLQLMHASEDAAGLVWGIQFSPDESKLAVGFGPNWNWDPRDRFLIVVPIDRPRTPVRQFAIGSAGNPPRSVPFGASARTIGWSPSSETLVVGASEPFVSSLTTKTPCRVPRGFGFGGFLSDDRMVVSRDGYPGYGEIQILRSDCSVADRWQVVRTSVLDSSPERNLIAVHHSADDQSWVIELVSADGDRKLKTTLASSFLSIYSAGVLFAQNGKTICTGLRQGKTRTDTGEACYDVDTGVKISENTKVRVDVKQSRVAGVTFSQ